MKIIVASDQHGRRGLLNQISNYHPDADYYLFCGDLGMDEPSNYPNWIFVKGNVDVCDVPKRRFIKVNNHEIMLTHYEVDVVNVCKKYGSDIICYGHTHVPNIRTKDGITCINPGALNKARDGFECSYCILEIDEAIKTSIVFERDWKFL